MVEIIEVVISVPVTSTFGMVTVLACYFECLMNLIVFETYTFAYQDSTVIIDHEYNKS
jgi:hypothetical protein